MLGIVVGAAGLWMTEAMAPFATAVLVIVAQIYLLGMPGGPLGLGATGPLDSYQIFLIPLASPVLVLFFGGFVLALAVRKYGLDKRLAKALLRPFGDRPATLLLGIILITGVFSMIMSNTATTALMIAIIAPLLQGRAKDDNFSRALLLGVPFSANLGGIGTIIGSPPNAIAATALLEMGHAVTFAKWMALGIPVALMLLFVLWGILLLLYRPSGERRQLEYPEVQEAGTAVAVVAVVFGLTVALWLLEPLHGVPAALVALIPIAIFAPLGVTSVDDLRLLNWDVLILIGGGLSLAVGMQRSGLSLFLVEMIPFGRLALLPLMAAFALATVVFSNLMSSTAVANLLIPIAVGVATWSPMVGALLVAFSAALGMSLPVSTPPNAIAYASRRLELRDMAFTGSIVTVFGFAIVLAAFFLVIRYTEYFNLMR